MPASGLQNLGNYGFLSNRRRFFSNRASLTCIVEGAEATAPFDFPIPIDAITVAIFDSLSYQPPSPNL